MQSWTHDSTPLIKFLSFFVRSCKLYLESGLLLKFSARHNHTSREVSKVWGTSSDRVPKIHEWTSWSVQDQCSYRGFFLLRSCHCHEPWCESELVMGLHRSQNLDVSGLLCLPQKVLAVIKLQGHWPKDMEIAWKEERIQRIRIDTC